MRLALVLLAAFLGGCASAQTIPSSPGAAVQYYAPVATEEVLVFRSADQVDRPYDVIGEISASGSKGWFKNQGELVEKTRKEAAKLGADAIIADPTIAARGISDIYGWVTAIKFTAATTAAAMR
ncbi:MAG TPA: hypothetical protein VK911_05910 [Vicinamibacterales bacterium]|nr:hypothetical protein [Vicinamibacterales bacterium]